MTAATVGSAGLRDERLWYLGRMRLNPAGVATLADLLAAHVAADRGHARKVAAVDLDGTIWGGVVGEAGVGGLTLGEEGLGLAYGDLQRELVKLHDAGVLIVSCSKNDRVDVEDAFAHHPGMILRREHLAAGRVNWQDKATNLRELAAELNLGLDSFVFLDDNPVERDWVRQALPQVAVPELPADPALRPAFVRSLRLFARRGVTEADRGRTASYRQEAERTALRRETTSYEDFLLSLGQHATVAPVDGQSLARAAQLCARTNQFNLTARRHTEADLEAMLAAPDRELYTLSLDDRFGSAGITGLLILAFEGPEPEAGAEIDTFLLSCRVLGRRVEDALLAFAAERAAARGARWLNGSYVPTPRNGQAASFLPDRGFEAAGDGRFRIDLFSHDIPYPAAPALEVLAHA